MLAVNDIAHCFATRDEAVDAFNQFDQDGNGDISMDELEMSVLEVHRERLALASSMRDIDSAVARLDQILMVIWYIAACVCLDQMSPYLLNRGTSVGSLSFRSSKDITRHGISHIFHPKSQMERHLIRLCGSRAPLIPILFDTASAKTTISTNSITLPENSQQSTGLTDFETPSLSFAWKLCMFLRQSEKFASISPFFDIASPEYLLE